MREESVRLARVEETGVSPAQDVARLQADIEALEVGGGE